MVFGREKEQKEGGASENIIWQKVIPQKSVTFQMLNAHDYRCSHKISSHVGQLSLTTYATNPKSDGLAFTANIVDYGS